MRSVGGKMLVIFLSRVLVGERRNHKPLLGCEFNYWDSFFPDLNERLERLSSV
jgi:hypothetical protein